MTYAELRTLEDAAGIRCQEADRAARAAFQDLVAFHSEEDAEGALVAYMAARRARSRARAAYDKAVNDRAECERDVSELIALIGA
jgi:hypothetical protein